MSGVTDLSVRRGTLLPPAAKCRAPQNPSPGQHNKPLEVTAHIDTHGGPGSVKAIMQSVHFQKSLVENVTNYITRRDDARRLKGQTVTNL